MTHLISVIIPIYNSEKTLTRCIEAVLKQTYSNLEIILINDGSKDSSKNICEEFAKNDNRIVLINKENEGVGRARNVGLEKATGDFITFVDSDDYLENNAIEVLYRALVENKVDCVRGNYDIITSNKISTNSENSENKKYEKDDFVYHLLTDRFKAFLWLLLVKRECIKDKFSEEIFLYEDFDFYLSVLGNVDSIYTLSTITYHYVIDNKDSLSRNENKIDLKIEEFKKARSVVRETMKKYSFDSAKNLEVLDTTIIKNIINYYYYKYKVNKNVSKIMDDFKVLEKDPIFIEMYKNYNDKTLSKKEKLFNKSLFKHNTFLFYLLCKIKDVLAVIRSPKKKKIFLKGYMCKNLGDDIFFKMFVDRYGENNKIYIYADSEYKKILNNKVVNCKNIFTILFNRTLKLITRNKFDIYNLLNKKVDASVKIGGSIFDQEKDVSYKNNLESEYSNKYYILGSNFGPYKDEEYVNTYKKVFENAEDVCFRDEYSYNLFKDVSKVRYTSDIVYGLDVSKFINNSQKKVIISVVDCETKLDKKYKVEYNKKIIQMIKCLIEKKYEIVLMSFCKIENDETVINEIYDILEENIKTKVSKYFYDGNIEEALEVLSNSEVIIGSRFHANILGLIMNKTLVPIAYSNKTINALKDIDFPEDKILDIRNLENVDIPKMFENLDYKMLVEKQISASKKQFKVLDMNF